MEASKLGDFWVANGLKGDPEISTRDPEIFPVLKIAPAKGCSYLHSGEQGVVPGHPPLFPNLLYNAQAPSKTFAILPSSLAAPWSPDPASSAPQTSTSTRISPTYSCSCHFPPTSPPCTRACVSGARKPPTCWLGKCWWNTDPVFLALSSYIPSTFTFSCGTESYSPLVGHHVHLHPSPAIPCRAPQSQPARPPPSQPTS